MSKRIRDLITRTRNIHQGWAKCKDEMTKPIIEAKLCELTLPLCDALESLLPPEDGVLTHEPYTDCRPPRESPLEPIEDLLLRARNISFEKLQTARKIVRSADQAREDVDYYLELISLYDQLHTLITKKPEKD